MFERAQHTVASTDGVELVAYHFHDDGDTDSNNGNGAELPPLLFSHATGFHGRVFSPVAAHLAGFSRTTFDYR
ncbi:MAG: hypothetical protein ACO288_07595, partial [Ilumatobacteraceae bacterium]